VLDKSLHVEFVVTLSSSVLVALLLLVDVDASNSCLKKYSSLV